MQISTLSWSEYSPPGNTATQNEAIPIGPAWLKVYGHQQQKKNLSLAVIDIKVVLPYI